MACDSYSIGFASKASLDLIIGNYYRWPAIAALKIVGWMGIANTPLSMTGQELKIRNSIYDRNRFRYFRP
jgi:hypothetical protein